MEDITITEEADLGAAWRRGRKATVVK